MRFLRWCDSAWWRCMETGCRCGRPGGQDSLGRRRAGRGSTNDGRRSASGCSIWSAWRRPHPWSPRRGEVATASSVVAAPGGGGGGTVTRAPLPRPSPRARCLVSPQDYLPSSSRGWASSFGRGRNTSCRWSMQQQQ
ncbi:hypothetical protein VPH35_123060 [Triticum aestivum]